jgi:PAS domain S-box-containing protein
MNDISTHDHLNAASQELGFLRSVLDASADCIKILNLDGRVTFMSSCGQMLMQVSDVSQVVGRAWYDFWEGDARAEALSAVAAARMGGQGRFRAKRNTFAGTPKCWDVRVSAILDASGVPEKLLCVSTDITEMQNGIEALELSEARLVMALQASGVVGLWNWDLRTGVIYGDANFNRMYEVSAEHAAAGLSFADFVPKFHPEDRVLIEKQLQHTFAQDREFSSEYRLLTAAGGIRWISARGRMLHASEGVYAVFSGSSVDITDQKTFEIRQAFLLSLSDSLRLLTDATAVLACVADALGRHLRVDRLGFARMLPDGESMFFEGGYSPECAVVHGSYPLTCFGTQHATRLRHGLSLVCDDASLDADTHTHSRTRTPSTLANCDAVHSIEPSVGSTPNLGYSAHWEALDVLAFIVVPQMRAGQLHAMLYAHSRAVRFWSPDDVALIEDVAARAWDALERVRAETELRNSEKRLSTAVKITSLATFQWDTANNSVYLSARGREIFGFDDHQAITASDMLERMHPHDVERVQAEALQAATGASLQTTYRVVRPDGSVRWVRSVNDALTPLPGQALQQVGVFEDVTDHMLAEQTLRTSEQQFRTLAQSLPHQVWTCHPSGRMDWLNARVSEFFGETADQLLASNFADKVHPDDLPEVQRYWRDAVPLGLPLKYEMRLKRGDGVYRWHIARAEALRGEDGDIKRWVGTSTDIEEQHVARELLRHTNSDLEARLASQARERDRAWKNSIDLQVIIGADGLIRAANEAWFTVLGWRAQEVVGRDPAEFSLPEDRRPDGEILAVGWVTAVSLYGNRMRHADGGYRWIAWATAPEGDLVYASGRDITAEKQAAADLQAAQSQLRQSQKMEAVGQLTGGVAHDFNNLLQVISANLQLMRKHAADTDKWRNRLTSAEDAVRRGAKLASQLLAFSRQQALEPKVINVGRFVLGMEDMIRRVMGDAIVVETRIVESPWNALIDVAQIENAVLNLAINGRDAMQGSGTLTLAVTNETVAAADAGMLLRASDLAELAYGDYVKLSVEDTGSGMTPEVITQIFEPFFSTKAVGSGTGLGLSMVYGFVKQSGGHVQVHSTVGAGTTMALYLPRAEQVEEPLRELNLGPVLGGSETILVAEDDVGVRAALVELLTDLGYHVLQAENADRALEVINRSASSADKNDVIDLLLTDVVMPGQLKSTDLVQLAQQRLPNMAVLYTSGYALNVTGPSHRFVSGAELLSKPYTSDVLARKLRQVLGKPNRV